MLQPLIALKGLRTTALEKLTEDCSGMRNSVGFIAKILKNRLPTLRLLRSHRWRLPMLLFASWLFVGCQSKPEGDSSAAPVSRATANQPAAAGKPVHRDRRPNEHSASTASRKHADSSPPNRNNPIGHAITVGGLREVPDGHLELAILDPADNEITGRRADGAAGGNRGFELARHDWLPTPHRLKVHWGSQRPAIELREGRFFTIVAAVLVQPAAATTRLTVNATAPRIPDLSQNLQPQWPGLCGAAAAADVLYRIGHHDPAIIAGHAFGPAIAADRDANRLIAGVPGAHVHPNENPPVITPDSLAGRMANRDGNGATALGIVGGLRSWIDDHVKDAWRADLAFLDDAPAGRSPADQQAWFGRLGSAITSGGGGLLLLWEGADWIDEQTRQREDRSQDADPRFPPLTSQAAAAPRQTANAGNATSEHSPADASDASAVEVEPERPQTAAVTAINQNLEEAQQALASGRHDAARRLAEKVLKAGLPIRFETPGIEAALDAARAISAEADRDAPKNSRARSGIRTRYDG